MKKDTIRDIKIFENLFSSLMEINFIKDIFFKKLKSFANTTDIEDLKKWEFLTVYYVKRNGII